MGFLKLKWVLLFILFSSGHVFAQLSPAIEKHIPKGWKVIRVVHGDLNSDKQSDSVIVLQKTDAKNIFHNKALGPELLDTNPRRIMILFQQGKDYHNVLSTDRFLPPENDRDNSCLMDPLEDGEISIKRGVLRISLRYWQSCGSWGSTTRTYTFRYQGKRFRLIGFDSFYFSRATGDAEEESVNFLTGKKKITTGGNIMDGDDSPKSTWHKLKNPKKQYLDTMETSW